MNNELADLLKYAWLFVGSLIGGIIGHFTRTKEDKKRRHLFIAVSSSLFMGFVTYEFVYYFVAHKGISLASGAFAAFIGIDLALTIEKKIIELVERKINKL